MNFEDLRQLAAVVRELPLDAVLISRGAMRDQRDQRKWQTEQGPLSISGAKFMNWQRNIGGGGAIDLVMHLGEMDFRSAVTWLAEHLAVGEAITHSSASNQPTVPRVRELRLPIRDDRLLARVRNYLAGRRHLPTALLDSLIECGRLYADHRGNAVFLLVAGKPNRPMGAELRGTGASIWRGMAPGTQKDSGYFWVGETGSQQIILCESAIDAISCSAIHPDRICISTSGVRSNPRWLANLIRCGYEIRCGFDSDIAGDNAADAMITLYPSVKRLRPQGKDWNDVLVPTRR